MFFQTGKFRWDGIVLVTGRNVAVAFKGDSDTEIRGALIGSETNARGAGRLLRVLQPHDRHDDRAREQAEHRHGAAGPLQHAHHLVSGSMQRVPLLVAVVAHGAGARLPAGARAPFRRRPAPAPAPPHVSPAAQLKAEGDALVAKADHRAARGGLSPGRRPSTPTTCRSASRSATAYTFLDQKRRGHRDVSRGRGPRRPGQRGVPRGEAVAGGGGGAHRRARSARAPRSPRRRRKRRPEAAATPEKHRRRTSRGHMEWPGIDPSGARRSAGRCGSTARTA